MEKVEANRLEAEQNNQISKKLRNEIEEQKTKLEQEKEQIIKQKESEINKAREQAMRIVKKVTIKSQYLIDELDELRKSKDKENFSKLAIEAK